MMSVGSTKFMPISLISILPKWVRVYKFHGVALSSIFFLFSSSNLRLFHYQTSVTFFKGLLHFKGKSEPGQQLATDVALLKEEQSNGASKAWQVFQPVRTHQPQLGNLSKPTFNSISIFYFSKVQECTSSLLLGKIKVLTQDVMIK